MMLYNLNILIKIDILDIALLKFYAVFAVLGFILYNTLLYYHGCYMHTQHLAYILYILVVILICFILTILF